MYRLHSILLRKKKFSRSAVLPTAIWQLRDVLLLEELHERFADAKKIDRLVLRVCLRSGNQEHQYFHSRRSPYLPNTYKPVPTKSPPIPLTTPSLKSTTRPISSSPPSPPSYPSILSLHTHAPLHLTRQNSIPSSPTPLQPRSPNRRRAHRI